ncbi:hypothetical protein, partial [Nostoc sp.]|uniref:hypothetical protein n=1 Tax=Nostoc sp. TaxID=1180 RepID=UPI002FFC8085
VGFWHEYSRILQRNSLYTLRPNHNGDCYKSKKSKLGENNLAEATLYVYVQFGISQEHEFSCCLIPKLCSKLGC